MDWKSYITDLYLKDERVDLEITPIFSGPTSIEAITTVEQKLCISFPDELNLLLLATNGVCESMKTDKWEGEIGYLLWPLERIEKENLFFRSHEDYLDIYMPFDNLLFIADAGNGDNFGYSILNGKIRRTSIYAWNHENDSRVCVAPSLWVFVQWWKLGKIHI